MSFSQTKWAYFPKVKIVTAERKNLLVSIVEFQQNLKNDNELKNLYGGPRSLLYLCSNDFSFPFEFLEKIMPISDILDIASSIPKSNSSFTSQSFRFEFFKKYNYIQFRIPVCQYEGDFVLNYDFSFKSTFTTKMALQLFTKTLDIELQSAFFVSSKSEIFESDFDNFLKAIIFDKVYLVAQLTSKKIKKIKERINAIHEILESEITYNIRLQKVKDDIVKFLGEHSILDNETQILFESLIESLYSMSNEIKDKISSYRSYYMVPIGKIFFKFTKLIPIYHRYGEILAEAMKNFQISMEDPIFQTFVNKFQSEPYFELLSIDQYMHEPEQRLPRYRLFLQRIFDITPWGHPDKVLLMSVLEKFNDERIKNNDLSLFDQATLDKYPLDLKQYAQYLPLEEGQGYICYYNILFDNQESIIVLYSDCIRVLNLTTQLTKFMDYLLLRIISSQDDDVENDNNSVSNTLNECTIFVFNCHYKIKFSSKNDLNSFILNVKEASYMAQIKNTNSVVGLFWNNKMPNCPIHLQHHSMSELNGTIYVFGGIDEKGQISSSFISYKISENLWKIHEKSEKSSIPQPRKDAVMITVNDKIYLFAGYSENMNPFNDLWTFDGNDWILIQSNVEITKGGYYSATKILNDEILFVGGNEKIQTLIYDTNKNQWKEICENSNIPLMKYHNISFCEKSGLILLLGGMLVSENEPVKNLFVLDLKTNCWVKNSKTLIGQFPSPRYGNLMICLKSYIFILGGIGSNTPFALSYNYSHNFFHLIRNEGKFPMFMSFAASCVANDAIWALGGASEDGTSDIFYKITILRG